MNSMGRWVGRVALVTGASAGIGRSIAEILVKEGMVVWGCARNIQPIKVGFTKYLYIYILLQLSTYLLSSHEYYFIKTICMTSQGRFKFFCLYGLLQLYTYLSSSSDYYFGSDFGQCLRNKYRQTRIPLIWKGWLKSICKSSLCRK
jgi:hypothetical protein